jgi:hypothetical protein
MPRCAMTGRPTPPDGQRRSRPEGARLAEIAADIGADTVSKVVHRRRRKALQKPFSQSAPIVNNFAANAAEHCRGC